jgi:serine/threonine protein kinase
MRQQRVLLASRYEIVNSVPGDAASSCFFGIDTTAGRSVVVRLTAPPQSRWLAAARGATHRYLASVIDVVDSPDIQAFPPTATFIAGTQAIVAEALRGPSLREHIQTEPLGLDRAVAWTLRIAEAIRSLHTRGAAHGAISPHSILSEARGRAISPVITQLLLPQLGTFASPERLLGEGPSPSDDLWAIGVLLYFLATGSLPYQGNSPTTLLKSIQETEINHFSAMTGTFLRELEVIVMRLISPQRRRRPASIDDVIDTLDRWERRSPMSIQSGAPAVVDRHPLNRAAKLAAWDEVVFDETQLPTNIEESLTAIEDARASVYAKSVAASAEQRPASIEQRQAAAVSEGFTTRRPSIVSVEPGRRRISSDSFSLRLRRRPRWGVLAVLVALIGGVVGAAVVSLVGNAGSPGRSLVRAVQQRVSSSPAVSARVREHINPRKEQESCIRSYYPTDAFATDPDLEFVCKNENLIDVTQQLNALAILISADTVDGGTPDGGSIVANQHPARPSNSGGLVVTAGTTTRTWQLGWYELLATAIVQRNCCRELPAVKLPVTSGWCQQLQTVVTNIANLSTKSGDISSAVHAYDEAITCLMSQGRHTVYSYKGVPTVAQKAAFQQFLTHAAETDARRASRGN